MVHPVSKISIFFLFLQLALSCSPIPQDRQKFLIGFSQCCDDPWRDVMNSEMYRELAFHPEIGFEMRVAQSNSEIQVEQIRELASLGIDLLIVSPNESTPLTSAVEEVYRSGIPVLLIDRETDSELYTAYIGADNYEIGKTAANYIANRLNGKGKVIEIQFSLSMSPAYERSLGFRDALKEHSGLEVIAELNTGSRIEEVNDQLPSLLKQYPDANVIFGLTDLLAEKSYEVAREMGVADSIFFVGVDGIPGTGRGIQAVEDGILDASMLYPTGGADAIRLSLAILNHLPFEKENVLQTTVIDQSNARILNFQMKKVNSLQEDIDLQQKKALELSGHFQKQRTLILILILGLSLIVVLGGFLWRSLYLKQLANKQLEAKNQEVSNQKEELLKKQGEIIQMSNEVKEATAAKVNFFTNISHEFRTPLTLILAFSEDLMANSDRFSSEIKSSIRPIRENAFRMLRLINQLMDFRKMESNRMRVRASKNDLVEFVKNIMISYHKIADRRGIEFNLICRHEELFLWFDANMMDKVLFNILSNAFKFTPDNGKISIAISVDTFEKVVQIKVEDSGRGMTAEEAAHVFEPFYQGEDQDKSGTGIGLSLSLSLVKLHHGDILLKSIKGRGSRFTIVLPLGKAHFENEQLAGEEHHYFSDREYLFFENESLDQPGMTAPTGLTTSTGPKILIIEDNEELLLFLAEKLSGEYQIITAQRGDLGLEEALESTPDLIISDILLPGQDGLEITRTLKSDLRTSHIPVILLTARSTTEQLIEGTKAGADAYIIKPFNIQFLEEKIKNLLHNRELLKEIYTNDLVDFQRHRNLNPIDQEFIKKFLRYVDANFARQDFHVEDLCKELNISRSQLYRKVNALMGQSVNDYFQDARLKKAEELLLEGKLTISEIAYQIGYTSPDYFAKVFKSKYNIVPTQYRRKFEGKD